MLEWQRRWIRCFGPAAAAALLLSLLPQAVWAQATQEDPALILRRAEVTYLEGDYEGSVAMLEPLLKRTDLTKEQTAKTHELLAYCYDALDKEDKIRENVRTLLQMNRKYPMKSEWMADRMRRIVNEVQAELAAQDSVQTAQPPPERVEEPARPPDRLTEEETEKKGGSKKFLIFGAIGAAAIAGIVLLAGGGGDEDELDTLPTPPAVPTNR